MASKLKRDGFYVTKIEDLPDEKAFILFTNGSVHIPGDERSKRHPGHGYPAHDHSFLTTQVFLNKEALIEAVKRLDDSSFKKSYKVVAVSPVEVKKTLSVEIQEF